ncbi:methylmalonyl Co-A mutase-associated GTPase MeaB [Algoriphagus zhangzhouensis]|uniref:LAO/AO transport system kinase n=1 Tax=Algoriphagus zhangzhouensis TaxID=1073327 RepID=A0A1M7ZKQ4_9BACT|nr:methylmalonyl Co-A mutase-associated GTPase MeaB [Algoriphagus zhangzhouensis]TDY43133.1 methylmalonyl-CoA mutase metallochaperone MeaB [Algoriphagus zhangzhouensis]SHO65256.1 LAO/AO transport system kinase [Algoriphagus zhangzhouensis]
MRKRKSIEEYKKGILDGDRVLLSQAITLVESNLASDIRLAGDLVQELLPFSGKSIRIGITGVPGVGKSTFIEAFGSLLISMGKKVAVLAVDPTSQKTKGSILGDKTRMEKLSSDSRAFIRPSPSGSTLGGVSSKTREAMLLCEAAGFDVILVETVGVGQSETAVKGMVDFFLLLMLAGAGDELQGIKKGIMEMADALFINKADGDNVQAAKRAKVSYQNALHLFPLGENNWSAQVLMGSSVTKDGLESCWGLIEDFEGKMKMSGFWEKNRSEQRLSWLDESIQSELGKAFYRDSKVQDRLKIEREKVLAGELSPMKLARELTEMFFKS